MSLTLPKLPGLRPVLTKTPTWSTLVKRAASGRERRTERWAYPLWTFKLSYEVVRAKSGGLAASPISDGQGGVITDGQGDAILDGFGIALDEQAQLWELFNLARGKVGTWLFLDPSDNLVTDGPVGTGDGVMTTFQLHRAVDSWTEPVLAPLNPVVFAAGAPADCAVGADGTVVFAAPAAAGTVLTWSGQFYFICRFDDDALTLAQIVRQLWEGKSVAFTTVRG